MLRVFASVSGQELLAVSTEELGDVEYVEVSSTASCMASAMPAEAREGWTGIERLFAA